MGAVLSRWTGVIAGIWAALPASATPLGPSQGCIWDSQSPAPIRRVEGPSAVVDGKVYVFGGFYDSALRATEQVHVYDPGTDLWTRRADMPVALTHGALAVDDRTVWILGGFSGNHPGPVIADTFRYDTVTDTWSSGPSLPAPRGSGGAARLGRNLHYFGGVSTDKEVSLGDHFVLDLDNLAAGWSAATAMPVPRNHLGSTDFGGRAYAIGGQFRHSNNPEDVDWVHAYDPATQAWTELEPLPFPRSHFEPGTFSMNGKVVIAGGRANTLGHLSVPDVTAYDPFTDTWQSLPPLPEALIAPVAKAFADRVLISSGGVTAVSPDVATYTRLQSAALGNELRINAGGTPFLSQSGGEEWCVDLGAVMGRSYRNPAVTSITGTEDDELYITERSGGGSNPARFGYRIPVSDGLYRVRLHFAELFWGAPGGGPGGIGRRVFDVTLENELILDDLDITAEVGATTALVRTFDVRIADQAVDLEFHSNADRPKISGLEILRLPDAAFENYCIGAPNSAGPGASLSFGGSISVADNHFELRATGLPSSVTSLFLQGTNRPQLPLGSGFRCVGGFVYRLPPLTQASGTGHAAHLLDLTNPPQPAGQILPGSSWSFQAWYRDGPTSNLTDGLGVTFTQ